MATGGHRGERDATGVFETARRRHELSASASPRPSVAPVAAGQHVATITYRAREGAATHDQPVVAHEDPTGVGFNLGGHPKLEDAVAKARANSADMGPAAGGSRSTVAATA